MDKSIGMRKQSNKTAVKACKRNVKGWKRPKIIHLTPTKSKNKNYCATAGTDCIPEPWLRSPSYNLKSWSNFVL